MQVFRRPFVSVAAVFIVAFASLGTFLGCGNNQTETNTKFVDVSGAKNTAHESQLASVADIDLTGVDAQIFEGQLTKLIAKKQARYTTLRKNYAARTPGQKLSAPVAVDPSSERTAFVAWLGHLTAAIHGDLRAIKVDYETEIEKISGKKIIYNRDASEFYRLFVDNRMQCLSGSHLWIYLGLKKFGLAALSAQHTIVIFEPGHVLPGFMVGASDGFHLYGIETTKDGRALTYYGPASSLSGPTRVVDLVYYLSFLSPQLRAGTPSGKISALVKESLRLSAARYGISLTKTEAAIKRELGAAGTTAGFAFGDANTPYGDQIRADGSSNSVKGSARRFVELEDLISPPTAALNESVRGFSGESYWAAPIYGEYTGRLSNGQAFSLTLLPDQTLLLATQGGPFKVSVRARYAADISQRGAVNGPDIAFVLQSELFWVDLPTRGQQQVSIQGEILFSAQFGTFRQNAPQSQLIARSLGPLFSYSAPNKLQFAPGLTKVQ